MVTTDLDSIFFSGASEDVDLFNLLTDEQLGGCSDEVVAKSLGHKREGPRQNLMAQ